MILSVLKVMLGIFDIRLSLSLYVCKYIYIRTHVSIPYNTMPGIACC